MLCRMDGAPWSSEIKKLVTAFVLATLAATPALAKTYHPRKPVTAETTGFYLASKSSYGSYAAADAYSYGPAVVSYGVYAGWDPDPAIRLQLIRDPGSVNSQ
jgi:hypothetical protein